MPSLFAPDAVEDALLRGEWTQALNESRNMLAARILQIRQEAAIITIDDADLTGYMFCDSRERVLSVYLQAVFELDLDDEVETAMTIIQAFKPLPSGVAIQWSNFLVAMNRRPMATQALKELLSSYGEKSYSAEQYAKAAEMLALQLLLVDEGIDAARRSVTADSVLDDAAKLLLLQKIQAAHLAAKEASKTVEHASVDPVASNWSRGAVQHENDALSTLSTGFTGSQTHDAEQDDDSSCYVVIGGTAIALAVAAAGALRYREKIQEAVSNAIPVISKGLADAKYALFEA
ncbi:hypothetical protein P3T76_005212 [Phytophthora citrophthora]|uniref:Uncharacterized protein n=1 Tax=Phytophthora citrophthora TaxID=4793 RepID=A0AAD9GTE3_9STRA|nr:hypothetical protein P3T76_005212 [Phytophthora citrophthora]